MTERPEPSPKVLVGVLVFASVAVWAAAFVATTRGALVPWVSAVSLLAGLAAGAVAAWRCDGADPKLWGAQGRSPG